MTYSKVSNKTQDKDIKYLSKDYNSFKDQLMDFAEVYFPNNFNDFSEGNPGMMFMEMAAYVGDVLSYYTDTQLQESFLLLAKEKENLFNLAYAMGYKPKVVDASNVDLEIFQLLPSTGASGNYSPDFDYCLQINPNSTFISTEGPTFYINNEVDFKVSSSFDPTEINIYQYDSSNNPQYYLLKKKTKAISGQTKEQTFTCGAAEAFKTFTLFDTNIISIESIKDADGNEYYEVPYLAQDLIFEEQENLGTNDPELLGFNNQTPYLLKIKKSSRRFVSRFKANNQLEIQFGAGNSDKADEQIIPNPDNIGLGIKDGRSKLDTAYDPSNFLMTKAYGQVPSNTTLTVKYIIGGGINSNVNANTITETDTIFSSNNPNLNGSLLNFVKTSIAVNNPEAAKGGGDGDSIEEIRENTMAQFATQNRTVTKEDYIVRTLSMPSKFGRVAKAYITQDDQISPLVSSPGRIPNPMALNLYVLGYNKNKQLTTLNEATKTNLATYLEQHRMLTDAINIKDAYHINIQLEFEIVTFKNFNNQEVLFNCIEELKDYFKIDKWQVNQPIIKSEIFNNIGAVKGVQSVVDVRLNNIANEIQGYSPYKYDLDDATLKGIIYPSLDPSIFEIRFPSEDIKGRITQY